MLRQQAVLAMALALVLAGTTTRGAEDSGNTGAAAADALTVEPWGTAVFAERLAVADGSPLGLDNTAVLHAQGSWAAPLASGAEPLQPLQDNASGSSSSSSSSSTDSGSATDASSSDAVGLRTELLVSGLPTLVILAVSPDAGTAAGEEGAAGESVAEDFAVDAAGELWLVEVTALLRERRGGTEWALAARRLGGADLPSAGAAGGGDGADANATAPLFLLSSSSSGGNATIALEGGLPTAAARLLRDARCGAEGGRCAAVLVFGDALLGGGSDAGVERVELQPGAGIVPGDGGAAAAGLCAPRHGFGYEFDNGGAQWLLSDLTTDAAAPVPFAAAVAAATTAAEDSASAAAAGGSGAAQEGKGMDGEDEQREERVHAEVEPADEARDVSGDEAAAAGGGERFINGSSTGSSNNGKGARYYTTRAENPPAGKMTCVLKLFDYAQGFQSGGWYAQRTMVWNLDGTQCWEWRDFRQYRFTEQGGNPSPIPTNPTAADYALGALNDNTWSWKLDCACTDGANCQTLAAQTGTLQLYRDVIWWDTARLDRPLNAAPFTCTAAACTATEDLPDGWRDVLSAFRLCFSQYSRGTYLGGGMDYSKSAEGAPAQGSSQPGGRQAQGGGGGNGGGAAEEVAITPALQAGGGGGGGGGGGRGNNNNNNNGAKAVAQAGPSPANKGRRRPQQQTKRGQQQQQKKQQQQQQQQQPRPKAANGNGNGRR